MANTFSIRCLHSFLHLMQKSEALGGERWLVASVVMCSAHLAAIRGVACEDTARFVHVCIVSVELTSLILQYADIRRNNYDRCRVRSMV